MQKMYHRCGSKADFAKITRQLARSVIRIAAMIPSGQARWQVAAEKRLRARGDLGPSMASVTDQVDSVNVVTNDAGHAISAIDYLPYGETWYQEGDTGFSPKYNSQELDKESGLYFFNARHYDPEIARFETADEEEDGEYSVVGWNRYTYVQGNPILYKDPTGHKAVPVVAAAKGGATPAASGGGAKGGGGKVSSSPVLKSKPIEIRDPASPMTAAQSASPLKLKLESQLISRLNAYSSDKLKSQKTYTSKDFTFTGFVDHLGGKPLGDIPNYPSTFFFAKGDFPIDPDFITKRLPRPGRHHDGAARKADYLTEHTNDLFFAPNHQFIVKRIGPYTDWGSTVEIQYTNAEGILVELQIAHMNIINDDLRQAYLHGTPLSGGTFIGMQTEPLGLWKGAHAHIMLKNLLTGKWIEGPKEIHKNIK